MISSVAWEPASANDDYDGNLTIAYAYAQVENEEWEEHNEWMLSMASWTVLGRLNKAVVHAMAENTSPWISASVAALKDRQFLAKVVLKTEQVGPGRQCVYDLFASEWMDITFAVEVQSLFRTALWRLFARIVCSYAKDSKAKKVVTVKILFRLKKPLRRLA